MTGRQTEKPCDIYAMHAMPPNNTDDGVSNEMLINTNKSRKSAVQ